MTKVESDVFVLCGEKRWKVNEGFALMTSK